MGCCSGVAQGPVHLRANILRACILQVPHPLFLEGFVVKQVRLLIHPPSLPSGLHFLIQGVMVQGLQGGVLKFGTPIKGFKIIPLSFEEDKKAAPVA